MIRTINLRDLLAQLRADDPPADLLTLTPDDRTRLAAILELQGNRRIVRAIRDYYGDFDRAQRTPRPLLYLHMGILLGLLGER